MRVRMTTNITGYRNSEPWPAPGDTLDVPDHEGADLITNGYAEPADAQAASEPADGEPAGTVAGAAPKKAPAKRAPRRAKS